MLQNKGDTAKRAKSSAPSAPAEINEVESGASISAKRGLSDRAEEESTIKRQRMSNEPLSEEEKTVPFSPEYEAAQILLMLKQGGLVKKDGEA